MNTSKLLQAVGIALLLVISAAPRNSFAAVGAVDLSFDPGSRIDDAVDNAIVQPDGRILVSGWFTRVNGLMRSRVARLHSDGRGDSSFIFNMDAHWDSMALQPDGKILLGSGVLVRLHSNGALDNTFTAAIETASDIPAQILDIIVQPDGKIIAGGYFATGPATNVYGLARVNSNGSFDSSFNPPSALRSCDFVRLLPDGKLIVAGALMTTNGLNSYIFRLHPNGSLDTNYNTREFSVGAVVVQPDGKLLVGGNFSQIDGQSRQGLARLNADGTLDSTFVPATNTYPEVFSIVLQSDGKVVVQRYGSIDRLNANGTLDASFANSANVVQKILPHPGDKLLVLGTVMIFGGKEHRRIVRLNADGTLDATFDAGRELPGPVKGITPLPDGKLLIGSPTPFISGSNRMAGARLNKDGSRDNTFTPSLVNWSQTLFPGEQYTFSFGPVGLQPDGKILVAGNALRIICDEFQCEYQGFNFLARVNANGTRDTNFPVNTNIAVEAMLLQPDGKLLAVGWLPDGAINRRVFRLNTNGTLDTNFANVVIGPTNVVGTAVSSLALQGDGKVLIGGIFNSVNGTIRNGIARLNANGSLDTSFNPGAGVTNSVLAIAVQPDGKILIGGSFTNVNGTARHRIARLNSSGSLDAVFNPGAGADKAVHAIALQPDGHVLLGGEFITVGGAVRPYVARLFGDSPLPALTHARSNNTLRISWPVTALNLQLRQSTSMGEAVSWSAVAESTVTNGGIVSVTVPLAGAQRFFRLVAP